MDRLACATCRMIRRFVLAFGAGVFVMWQVTGSLPAETPDNGMWRGFMFVAMFFLVAGVFFRMREMRARMRRSQRALRDAL